MATAGQVCPAVLFSTGGNLWIPEDVCQMRGRESYIGKVKSEENLFFAFLSGEYRSRIGALLHAMQEGKKSKTSHFRKINPFISPFTLKILQLLDFRPKRDPNYFYA